MSGGGFASGALVGNCLASLLRLEVLRCSSR